MKKAIACLLALPLALAACGVQNVPAQAAQPTDTPVETTTAPTTASTAPVEEPAHRLNQAPGKYTGAKANRCLRPLTRRRRNRACIVYRLLGCFFNTPLQSTKELPQDYNLSFFCCTKPLKARAKAVPIHKMIILLGNSGK